jgi:hypothetical protein
MYDNLLVQALHSQPGVPLHPKLPVKLLFWYCKLSQLSRLFVMVGELAVLLLFLLQEVCAVLRLHVC